MIRAYNETKNPHAEELQKKQKICVGCELEPLVFSAHTHN